MVAYNKDDAHKRNQTALRERANQWVLKGLMEKYDYEVVVQHDNLKKIWDTELREGTEAQMQRLKFYNDPHLRYEVQVKKAERLAEDQKANTQSAREQAARQKAVKMAHDVGLKVWDPEDLDALDNLPMQDCCSSSSCPSWPGADLPGCSGGLPGDRGGQPDADGPGARSERHLLRHEGPVRQAGARSEAQD